MRRTLVLALAALALLGVVTPDAFAQAPTPTFKINGLIDQLGTYSSNTSNYDGTLNRTDKMFYGRTRGRFDFIGEYGKAKGVLGIEIDMAYGQTGSNDSTIVNAGGAAASAVQTNFGSDGGFDLNTDTRGIVEIKWLYTEFEVPLLPVPTVVRLGAQPFGSASNYKLATYANGDFAGVNIVSTITPNVKIVWTYVQVEEGITGCNLPNGNRCTGGAGSITGGIQNDALNNQLRGGDFAVIAAPEITPIKGLDIKPMISYFYAQGTTSGSARQGRGGIGTTTAYTNADNSWKPGINENRYTVGVDGRWRSGPFSFDPTVLYQFGNRRTVVPNNTQAPGLAVASGLGAGTVQKADLNAWLIDMRAGWQIGPLLIEGLGMFSTGNRAQNSTLKHVNYFQPLSTDTSYLADWGPQLSALGVDYLNALNEAGLPIAYPGVSIGWDKYGRMQFGARATYAWTPNLSMTGGVNVHLTHRAVDTDGVSTSFIPGATAGGGLLPAYTTGKAAGDTNYMGTELNIGATWRFAPGLVLDSAFGYFIMGDGMNALTNPAYASSRDAKDAYILTSRVRFTF